MKFSTFAPLALFSIGVNADNLKEIAEAVGDLSTLNSLVEQAELGDAVAGLSSHTLFAPTNQAFTDLGEATIANIQKSYNDDLLKNTLLYHIVDKVLTIDANTPESEEETLFPMNKLTIGAGLKVNGNMFAGPAVPADTGAQAFVVNNVLVPSSVGEALGRSIAKIATDAGTFSSLLAALTAADLATMFAEASDTGYTVFAPTDDAFTSSLTALGVAFADLAANKTLLTEILTYHVVSGVVMAKDLTNGAMVKTLEGQTITYNDGKINDAKLTATDLRAFNGIVHVIDGVLLPDSAAATINLESENEDDSGSYRVFASTLAVVASCTSLFF